MYFFTYLPAYLTAHNVYEQRRPAERRRRSISARLSPSWDRSCFSCLPLTYNVQLVNRHHTSRPDRSQTCRLVLHLDLPNPSGWEAESTQVTGYILTWFTRPQTVTHTNPAAHGRESKSPPVYHKSDALPGPCTTKTVTATTTVVLVVQRFGVGLVIERSLVRLPAGALSSQSQGRHRPRSARGHIDWRYRECSLQLSATEHSVWPVPDSGTACPVTSSIVRLSTHSVVG